MAIRGDCGKASAQSDIKQVFLNGDIGEEKMYVRPPVWWPEHVPRIRAAIDEESVYGTLQEARQWHVRISI